MGSKHDVVLSRYKFLLLFIRQCHIVLSLSISGMRGHMTIYWYLLVRSATSFCFAVGNPSALDEMVLQLALNKVQICDDNHIVFKHLSCLCVILFEGGGRIAGIMLNS